MITPRVPLRLRGGLAGLLLSLRHGGGLLLALEENARIAAFEFDDPVFQIGQLLLHRRLMLTLRVFEPLDLADDALHLVLDRVEPAGGGAAADRAAKLRYVAF